MNTNDMIEKTIEYIKNTNPEKYKKAQAIGDNIMNLYRDNLEDKKGDEILLKIIFDRIKNYDLNENDLDEYEIKLLNKVYKSKEIWIKKINELKQYDN